ATAPPLFSTLSLHDALPILILYLTYWFPARERARTAALFLTATALAGVIGGPVSGLLLSLDGVGGLEGWQWVFLVEGVPAVVLRSEEHTSELQSLAYLVCRL